MVLRTVPGRRDSCLAAAEPGAVQAGVLQAAASPDCYRPYPAQSLDNLARALTALEQHAEADAARREAAKLR